MTDAAHFLTLDQGGHASRAILFDARGRMVAQSFVPIPTLRTPEGHIEHDARTIVDSLRTAVGDLPGDVRIAAAGLATQRSTIVCWHRRTGEALSPAISWQDRRNAAMIAGIDSDTAAHIHRLTGLVLSPHYGASKMRWCLDHYPKVRAAAAVGELAMGPLSSFVLFRLLRERPFVVDPANASRTQLWNPATGDWAPELLQLFGIETASLPRPVTSRYDYGTLEVGGRAVPLTVCTGDQAAVPFAFGRLRPDAAYVNFGTGAFILRPMIESNAPALLNSLLWSDEQTTIRALEGTVNGAGSALQWLADKEGFEVGRMLAPLGGQIDPQLRPPLFLNGISGLGSPFWIADFPSRFEGPGTVQEKFVAVLESILFLVRVNLEEMQHHSSPIEQVIVSGGLAGSDFLCQALADLVNLPVIRHAEREATARGLAYLVAGQPGEWPLPPAMQFRPRLNTALRERFFAWLKLMKQTISPQAQRPESP